MAPELDVKIKEPLLKNEDFMQMIYFEKSLLVPISLKKKKSSEKRDTEEVLLD